MDYRIIDLHTHTTESDGSFTPEELIEEMHMEEYYYNRTDILSEYVLEVLPNEN